MGGVTSLYRLKINQRLRYSILFSSITLGASLFLTGCSMPPQNSDDNFCMKVDPSSPSYDPNALSIEQLKICRERAEKILQVQTMQVQIHRQRDEVIALNNNDLIIENKAVIENALSKLPENKKLANNNKSPTAQKNGIVRNSAESDTSNGKPKAVQQHFLNRSSQRQFDARQAQSVATSVQTLINSEEKQAILNSPRSLQPGEEIRGGTNQPTRIDDSFSNQATSKPTNSMSAANTNSSTPTPNISKNLSQPSLGSESNNEKKISSDKLISTHSDSTNEEANKALNYKTIQTNNSVTKTLVKESDNTAGTKPAKDSLNQDKKSLETKKVPSTDYTSLPNFSAGTDKTGVSVNSAEATNSFKTEVKTKTIPEPIIDGKTRPDPLLRLQEIRNQN